MLTRLHIMCWESLDNTVGSHTMHIKINGKLTY